MNKSSNLNTCSIQEPDYSKIEIIVIDKTDNRYDKQMDYQQAMHCANKIAQEKLDDYMLLSWYDKDRDFESPQHSSECHADSAIPGYVDYGLYHGASLKIDFAQGRFVFFYRSF
jgi:hypothetical protein